jgi:hypothetical protein
MTTTLSNLNLTPWRGTDAAGKGLKPLAPVDFGLPAAPSALRPLTFADHVVGSKDARKSPHDRLVAQTQKWVAQTFYGTILKQMHNSPFRSDVFEGGRGGQAFGGLMDQQLAEHMARSPADKLDNSNDRRIEARAAYAKHQQGGPPVDNPNNATIRRDAADVTSALRA